MPLHRIEVTVGLGRITDVFADAVDWPFRAGVADVVLILGVLHHLSDWRAALDRACATVRPGGFLLLHEAVTKPRVLARWRSRGVDDDWVSPHEGDVPRSELLAFLSARGEESPLRFGLVRFVVHRFDARLERSRALTIGLNALDQAFGRTLGRLSRASASTRSRLCGGRAPSRNPPARSRRSPQRPAPR